MISATSLTASAGAAGATASDSTTAKQSSDVSTDPLAQKEAFLKLLVAQIKNQNPLNPADGIEFISQLAQFSQLEQMLSIRSELEAIRKSLTEPPASQPASTGTEASKGA